MGVLPFKSHLCARPLHPLHPPKTLSARPLVTSLGIMLTAFSGVSLYLQHTMQHCAWHLKRRSFRPCWLENIYGQFLQTTEMTGGDGGTKTAECQVASPLSCSAKA